MLPHGLSFRAAFPWQALAMAGALAALLLLAGTARGDDLKPGSGSACARPAVARLC
jgi:hypothetical protein